MKQSDCKRKKSSSLSQSERSCYLTLSWRILLLLALTGCAHIGAEPAHAVQTRIPQDSHDNTGPSLAAHFCPPEDCGAILSSLIADATTADCALYDVSDERVLDALSTVDARIVTHQPNAWKLSSLSPLHVRYAAAGRNGLMHNKFCVLQEADGTGTLVTGSFNPTGSDSINDLVVISDIALPQPTRSSAYLLTDAFTFGRKRFALDAQRAYTTYATEFDELWQSTYRGGPTGAYEGTSLSARFCPDDDCQGALLTEIALARRSVHFFLYVLSDDMIALALADASHRGVAVSGVVDDSLDRYDATALLRQAGITVLEHHGALLHHKAWVIDEETVITGSYNPTANGNTANDENMLIIRDRRIAAQYDTRWRELMSSQT